MAGKRFLVRNYNRFLVKDRNGSWEDFYIHRFPSDVKRLMTFSSERDAEKFLKSRPDLEERFDGWILPLDVSDWNGSRC